MSIRTKFSVILFSVFFGVLSLNALKASDTVNVKLYTPFTKISVSPGQTIDYMVDIFNNSNETRDVGISVSGFPRGWTYTLVSGGYSITQISVLPGEKRAFNLKVEVPMNVNKGNYRFQVTAGGFDVLPLTVTVSAKGSFKTEFTTRQANMEGSSSAAFSFQATLKNLTGDKQLYALMTNVPRGWSVIFKANYKQVTSVEIEAGSSADITVDVDPPDMIEAGSYKIPLRAATIASSADLEIEVVITGSYRMVLTTPSGLLSTNITAGEEKRVELVVNNTGSGELRDIKFTASAPINWDVKFDPKEIIKLEAGKSASLFATIKADKRAISGDYITNMEAQTPETSAKASFRISVKTPMLYGWIGIFIIIVALGSVWYLFRKYGRR